MGKYTTPDAVWKTLGPDTFTKVRGEIVGTPVGSAILDLSQENIISGSETIYKDTAPLISGTGSGSTSYSINYDDGRINFTNASGGEIAADYNYSTTPDSQMQAILSQSDEELELKTGRSFTVATTSEYLDVRDDQTEFYTRNYPVLTLSASVNQSYAGETASWTLQTEGTNYLMDSADKEIGRIEFIVPPLKGSKRIKLEYSYGYATIPALVKELNILLAMRKMINSTIYKSIFKGRDDYSPARLNEIENRIEELSALLRKQNFGPI
jgi:hypothetical protein